jgi:hypothetical protein
MFITPILRKTHLHWAQQITVGFVILFSRNIIGRLPPQETVNAEDERVIDDDFILFAGDSALDAEHAHSFRGSIKPTTSPNAIREYSHGETPCAVNHRVTLAHVCPPLRRIRLQ